MARKKIKITNLTTRQVMYSKRRSGLIRRAYELSVLSEIDCALIMFSPSGKLTHFSNRRIEDVLIKFINSGEEEMNKLSIPDKEGLTVFLENIKTQDMANEARNLLGDLGRLVHCSLDLEEHDWALRKCLDQVTKRKNYLLRKSVASASSSFPITVLHSAGTSSPQDQNLESLQLIGNGGATGFPNKENASTLEQKFKSLQLTNIGGVTGHIKN